MWFRIRHDWALHITGRAYTWGTLGHTETRGGQQQGTWQLAFISLVGSLQAGRHWTDLVVGQSGYLVSVTRVYPRPYVTWTTRGPSVLYQ